MTLVELLVFISVLVITVGTCSVVTSFFNIWAGIPAAFLALVVLFKIMGFLDRVSYRRRLRHRREMVEMMVKKYPRLFRVLTLPDENNIFKDAMPKNAEVKVGDYGWEASSFRKDDLIYLQGLNENWGIIWWAGFSPDQIEYVCPKPLSQYERPIPETPCPFPVQPRSDPVDV